MTKVPTYPSGSANPANAQLTALKNQAQSAQNSATTAMTVGILGAVFGILGLVTAGFALARKSRYVGASATKIKTPPNSLRG